jgi:predicted membrane-bound mannosyltransferase
VTTKRAGTFWLLGICALALALRLYKLGAPLWYDEILTLARFVRLPLGELLTTYTSLNNHVLFSLQAKLFSSLFGESAAVLRLPAVIMGVLSIAALYQLARKEVGSWDARLTAILLAVSYHHIWFSQNARPVTQSLDPICAVRRARRLHAPLRRHGVRRARRGLRALGARPLSALQAER